MLLFITANTKYSRYYVLCDPHFLLINIFLFPHYILRTFPLWLVVVVVVVVVVVLVYNLLLLVTGTL